MTAGPWRRAKRCPASASRAWGRWPRAATFPADTPNRQLDHILTDDQRLRGGAVESEVMPISDHRPLVVDLERA